MVTENFEQIYKDYFQLVYYYILSICKNPDIASEITQDTFFKALKSIDKFRGECDIHTWLCRIAKNTYFTYCRKNKVDFDVELLADLPADSEIAEKLEDKEYNDKIHQILHSLPEPYKEVFSLRVFCEMPFAKIGELFGKTNNWACVTYHRAKGMIQQRLER